MTRHMRAARNTRRASSFLRRSYCVSCASGGQPSTSGDLQLLSLGVDLRYGHLTAHFCSFESAGCIYEHHDSIILIRLVLAACLLCAFFSFKLWCLQLALLGIWFDLIPILLGLARLGWAICRAASWQCLCSSECSLMAHHSPAYRSSVVLEGAMFSGSLSLHTISNYKSPGIWELAAVLKEPPFTSRTIP
jgi:hypothetical protein